MPAHIIDGKSVAQSIQRSLQEEVKRLNQSFIEPCLAVIIVGTHAPSQIYVRNKQRACQLVDIKSILYELSENVSQEELLALIQELNHRESVHGILVQLPLPAQIDANTVLESIDPRKDVDGFHPYNIGRLAQRRPLLRPCTPYGVMQLLAHYRIDVRGLVATVVGASNIVGRPMALELLLAGATVTICHRFTRDLAQHIRDADLVVAAVGNPNIIQAEWIKLGAIVIDVGINRLADGRIVGDLDFNKVKERAGWLTPVPGGVGPMTIAMLLTNTITAAKINIADNRHCVKIK